MDARLMEGIVHSVQSARRESADCLKALKIAFIAILTLTAMH